MPKNDSLHDLINELMGGIQKSAEAETGERKPVSEGSRSSENASDVKGAVGGLNVNKAPAADSVPGAGVNTPTNSIGAKSAPTGEDVPTTKSTKDDPGTSHPAKAAGVTKYANASNSELVEGANELLARMVIFSKQAQGASVRQAPASANTKQAQGEVKQAEMPAGLAAAIAKKDKKKPEAPEAEPEKVEAPAEEKVSSAQVNEEILQKAAAWDELLGYCAGNAVAQNMVKAAQAQPAQVTDAELTKFAEAEAARLFDLANSHSTALLQLIAKEAELDPSLLAGGGAPPADPAMMAAADPAAAAAPAPGGGGDIDPQTLQLLIQALQEQGISPEDLLAGGAAAEGAGGGGGGDETSSNDHADAAAVAEESSEDNKEAPAEEKKEEKSAELKLLTDSFAKFCKAAGAAAKAKKS